MKEKEEDEENKIRKFAQNKQTDKQTDRQTDREFNYRGHSYPLWIVGGSRPITARTAAALYCRKKLENLLRTDRHTDKQTDRQRIQLQRPILSPVDRRGERANTTQILPIYLTQIILN